MKLSKTTLKKMYKRIEDSPSSLFTKDDVLNLLEELDVQEGELVDFETLRDGLNNLDFVVYLKEDGYQVSVDSDRKLQIDEFELDVDELYEDLVSNIKELTDDGWEDDTESETDKHDYNYETSGPNDHQINYKCKCGGKCKKNKKK